MIKSKNIFLSFAVLIFGIICLGLVSSSSISVWQGQYYTGTTFNTGTYAFNFTVYDALTGGNACFTNTTSLTTGSWGQWKTEQSPWSTCNNASKDYFLNINIAGTDESPRRRLVVSDFLRRDVEETKEGSLVISDNITASYYFGDGQYLTGINGSGDINSVQGDNIYIYNGSDSGNVLLAFNESRLNSTIDLRASGDNSSWNESYATSLYYSITNPYGFYNSSDFLISNYFTSAQILGFNYYNSTDFSISDYYSKTDIDNFNYWNDTYATFNKTYADTLYSTGAHTTDTNETTRMNSLVGTDCGAGNYSYGFDANGLIQCREDSGATYSHLSNFTDDLGNRGYTHLTNFTNNLGIGNWTLDKTSYSTTSQANALYYGISNPSNFWNDTYATFNKTYADTLYATAGSGNSSWNQSLADTLYYDLGNSFGYWNDTYATFNKTYADTLYATAGSGNSSWNQSLADTLYYDLSNSFGYWNDTYATFNKTYADTLYATAGSGNSSWNQSLADTLYYSITNPYGYYNSTNFVISNYFTKSELLSFNYYNATSLQNLSQLTNNLGIGNWTLDKVNYYTKTNIDSFNFWNDTYATFNKTYADTLYANIGVTGDNSSWNESYASTLYYSITNPFGFYNSTNPQTETDPLWTGNQTNVAFTNVEETFTGNVTVEGIKLEQDSTNHRIYDNATCVIIKGDTSTMYIC